MGAVNPERVTAAEWREWYETAGQLLAGGWEVVGSCPACDLVIGVRLQRVPAERSLWGQTLRCPRWRCEGRAAILGRPYQLRGIGQRGWLNLTTTELPSLRPRR